MFEVQILIPTSDNDGVVFTPEHHEAFEASLCDHFKGFTLYPEAASGGWVHDGRVYRDELRVYGVAVPSIVQGGRIGELAELAKLHYRQHAIFVRYLGRNEVL